MPGHTQNLETLIRAKNAALTSTICDKAAVAKTEMLLAEIAMAVGNFDGAAINLISAASLVSALAHKPIRVVRADSGS